MRAKSIIIENYEIIGIENDNKELETFGRTKNHPDLVYLQCGYPKFKDFNEETVKDLLDLYKKKINAQEEFIEKFYDEGKNAYLLNDENTELIDL